MINEGLDRCWESDDIVPAPAWARLSSSRNAARATWDDGKGVGAVAAAAQSAESAAAAAAETVAAAATVAAEKESAVAAAISVLQRPRVPLFAPGKPTVTPKEHLYLVRPRLWIGSEFGAVCGEALSEAGITHVFNVTAGSGKVPNAFARDPVVPRGKTLE